MDKFKFQVDLNGLISLLSDHLYSRNDVFIRELLQNGVDAIAVRRQIQKEFLEGILIIEYIQDKSGVQIVFRDNGIGLLEEELHQFLAVIGQSSKRGEEVRTNFIGQFGIGILSCFLVSDEIEVITCSGKDFSSHQWIGQANGIYHVAEAIWYKEVGTEIRLRLKKEIKSNFSRDDVYKALISYGFLLPIPIKFCYKGGECLINNIPIPWRQEFCTRGNIMEFGEIVFGEKFLDVVSLETKGVHGYAYISTRPLPSGGKLSHRIYLRSMFLTEDGRDLIPEWISFARCFIDARDLTPTASREGLQKNGDLIRIRTSIEHCLLEYFTVLTKFDITKMKLLAEIHNLAFKAFALENDKTLKLLFPFLSFSTNKGRLTGTQVLEAAKRHIVFYCIDIDSYRRVVPFLKYSKSLLINAGYVYEAEILRNLIRTNPNLPLKMFEDSLLEQLFENPEKEEMAVFDFLLLEFGEKLKTFHCRPVIKRLFPPELPCLFIEETDSFLKTELEVNSDEYSFLDGFENFEDFLKIEDCSTLYLNCNNTLIWNLSKILNPTIIHAIAKVLYVQARLSGHYVVSDKELNELSLGLSEIIEFAVGDDHYV